MLEIRHKAVRQGVSIGDAYDEFFQKTELQMRDSFYLWLIELLNPRPGATLLDIACGQGRLVQLAARRGFHAIGLDLSFEGMNKSARVAPDASWVVSDGQCIGMPDACLDYILNIGSLEHYPNPVQGVKEIARLLKPTGRACILLPNAFGLQGNIRRVWQTGEIFDDNQPLQRYGTLKTWSAMLAAGGLQIDRIVPWSEINFPRTLADFFLLVGRPQKLIRVLLAACTPLSLANHFVFICRRATEPGDATYPMLPVL